jgi:hypothetical protein
MLFPSGLDGRPDATTSDDANTVAIASTVCIAIGHAGAGILASGVANAV